MSAAGRLLCCVFCIAVCRVAMDIGDQVAQHYVEMPAVNADRKIVFRVQLCQQQQALQA